MKLSEKGISKIWSFIHKGNLKSALFSNTIDFGPDDFEGAVVLTVEEAKGIYETIEEAKDFLWKYHKVPLTKLGQKDFDTLKKRIEQAEKGNETNWESN